MAAQQGARARLDTPGEGGEHASEESTADGGPSIDGTLDSAFDSAIDGEPPRPDWTGTRLHVVTGKGGTGKTTVAAALALALASLGASVLLCEVEGRQGIAQTLDVAPLGTSETRLLRVAGGGQIWGLAVEPKAALMEYLRLFYHLGPAGGMLERLGAVDFATTIAPGVRDVLCIGKVYESASRRTAEGGFVFDAVVLDAPPTGRVLPFLTVNAEVAELAKVGPIRHQANSVTRLLRSDACRVHVVTLLEEMPVQEAVEAVEQLRAARLPLGALIVNQAQTAYLDEVSGALLRRGALSAERLAVLLESTSLMPHADPAVAEELLAQARDHAERLAAEDSLLLELQEQDAPVLVLPQAPDLDGSGSVRELAQGLADQAVWG